MPALKESTLCPNEHLHPLAATLHKHEHSSEIETEGNDIATNIPTCQTWYNYHAMYNFENNESMRQKAIDQKTHENAAKKYKIEKLWPP